MLKSRKFRITLLSLAGASIIPVVYKLLDIDISIINMVVGAFIALPSVYNVANALSKEKNV